MSLVVILPRSQVSQKRRTEMKNYASNPCANLTNFDNALFSYCFDKSIRASLNGTLLEYSSISDRVPDVNVPKRAILRCNINPNSISRRI